MRSHLAQCQCGKSKILHLVFCTFNTMYIIPIVHWNRTSTTNCFKVVASKTAHMNFRLTYAICNSQLINAHIVQFPQLSGQVARNRKYACSRWNFVIIVYTSWLCRVYFRLLWFLTNPHNGQCSKSSNSVAQPWKHGHSRWHFVAIVYTNWDTFYFLYNSG